MPAQETAHIDHLQRSLGRTIRELRSKHGWTQEEFAEYCGLHRTYLGHVERGEKNVSLSTILRLSNALGVRIPALFGHAQQVANAGLKHLRPPVNGPATSTSNNHTDVDRLLDELQAQRKAMRQVLRDISGFLVRITDSAS